MKGEFEFDNVKSLEVYRDDDDPDLSYLHFDMGELEITVVLTDDMRGDLTVQLNAPSV